MKKILVLFTLFSSLCFGSEFIYYESIKLKDCCKVLKYLDIYYEIISYKILPAESGGIFGDNIQYYSMIVEVEKRKEN